MLKFGVIDEVIPEPLGAAHRDPREMGNTLKNFLSRSLRELRGKPTDRLLDERFAKFRKMGFFDEVAV